MRVALYARVSTQEQTRGLSIDSQIDSLRRWSDEQGHTVVGEYVDPGISARKSPSKRPALQQLLSDIPTKGIELIAFIRLDRWTRNVKGYYQIQDVLDRNKVAWAAILEDYETLTSAGRFKVNIMLSIGEAEADRTSERINTVFEHKVIMGEAITGALPLGLKIENKRVVPDENAPAAKAVFEHYAMYGNKTRTRDMLQIEYGINLPPLTISHMLNNTLYKGEYRGNRNYCEPIVSSELFDRVQDDVKRRATWSPPSGRIYLFTGLLKCLECGHRLAVCSSGGKRISYRCPSHYVMKVCSHYTSIREDALEEELLQYVSSQVAEYQVEYKQSEKKKPSIKESIEGKLNRLKELYVDGDLSKEKYTAERDKLTAMLNEQKTQAQKPVMLLGIDFINDYKKLDRQRQKAFWREIIDHIDIDTDKHLYIYFR